MQQKLAHIAIVVRDYDEAIQFYTGVLGFRLAEDTVQSPTKRWVLVEPPGGGCQLLLARAANDEQATRIGNQTGGRVFLFLHTDDFRRDYQRLLAHNVRFVREPHDETYGTVAVFEDIYGNLWDLIEPKRRGELENPDEVTIVDYRPEYQKDFHDLNESWIKTYFKMEKSDYKALDDPQKYILDDGGEIVVALLGQKVVGVCALIRMDDPEFDFELAKMAVSPTVQGKGIGWILGQAVLEKARQLGARNVYLESNTRLTPAIQLYEKLGFVRVENRESPYERCNIQMAVNL
ncbi:MAG: GNAT family N-acetyltransferase [Saprospiraceae bacterium]|nr:GNAT family N-acetyltransferase [Saprospiraceae bacterium]